MRLPLEKIGENWVRVILWSIAVFGADAIRCFCDTRNCEDALCDGTWCLVGFQSDVRLVQNCGTDSAQALKQCATDWNGWDEVCSCQEDFCNTFSFLRSMMKKKTGGMGGGGGPGGIDHSSGGSNSHLMNGGGGGSPQGSDYPIDYSMDNEDSIIINRQNAVSDIESRPMPPQYPYQSNQLILLLVVIPLGVGALAVCLVFVNYHCKMC